MSKAKKTETIEVGQILALMKKLEKDASQQAALLKDIAEKISLLDLKQKIRVAKPWGGGCKYGPPYLD